VNEASSVSDELLVAEGLVTDAHPEAVSLRLRRGDRASVSGPSGAGKTTLLHTLVGWRQPRQGTAQLGSHSVGYVGVESTLLSGPLRDNLVLGADISDEIVRARLKSLGLIGPRFDDLDAELLSDGRGLSSGERVRLILARALLADVSLLVLDDIAGVLDADVRQQVRGALAREADLAIIEATVDTPLLATQTHRIELRS
jgi:ABC-type transport system involved in cytochrome bd biosynthesis fused ATPase/permease subunit